MHRFPINQAHTLRHHHTPHHQIDISSALAFAALSLSLDYFIDPLIASSIEPG